MAVPSIRGAAIQPVVERLCDLQAKGKLPLEEAGFRLEDTELAMLETGLDPAGWYPIASHDRLCGLLSDLAGDGSERFLDAFAFESARPLLVGGPCEPVLEAARGFGPSAGDALLQLADILFDFTRWEYAGDSLECFRVHVRDAEDFPETARLTTQGLLRYLAGLVVGEAIDVRSLRISPGSIVFDARVEG